MKLKSMTLKSKNYSMAMAVACLLCSGSQMFAAIDMWLNIPGIPSGSTSMQFPNQIQLASFSEGITNSVTILPSGATNGTPMVGSIVVTKTLDPTSPTLYLACAQGTELQNPVVLSVAKAGASPETVFYTLTLSNVWVTSVQSAGAPGSGAVQETVTLTCGQIQWSYTPTLANGSLGTPIVHSWNAQTGTGN